MDLPGDSTVLEVSLSNCRCVVELSVSEQMILTDGLERFVEGRRRVSSDAETDGIDFLSNNGLEE